MIVILQKLPYYNFDISWDQLMQIFKLYILLIFLYWCILYDEEYWIKHISHEMLLTFHLSWHIPLNNVFLIFFKSDQNSSILSIYPADIEIHVRSYYLISRIVKENWNFLKTLYLSRNLIPVLSTSSITINS